MTPTLTLYSRIGCCLCEDMRDALMDFQREYDFLLNIIDVDNDSYLKMRYGERVPVLAAGEEELFHYYFSPEVLRHYFRNL